VNISDIMWETMKEHWRAMVDTICRGYETDPKYTLEKIYEDGVLKGFFVWYDTPDYRMLEAGYYIGSNPLVALKMYKKMKRGAKVLRAFIQKPNERVWKTYLHIGFKVIGEDLNNYLLEKR
jgi:hypothetical protein